MQRCPDKLTDLAVIRRDESILKYAFATFVAQGDLKCFQQLRSKLTPTFSTHVVPFIISFKTA